ncbi:hypothetical protein FOL47_005031 [Perkinsus chesapeaki]|uniref:TOG domain-containing protein n=1 Tax=Perkinsus chesapeaki TaxID=330153 RepID=A0A7J6LZD9_PERCH|nr:hypothetical protein FOL47_005031 [Perkinsus chesapeaki]
MSARSIGLVVGGSASHKMVQGSIPPGDVFTQRSSSGDTVNNYPSSRGGINAFDEVPAVAGSNVAAAAAPSSKYDHHHHHHHQRSILEAGPNSIPSEYLGQDPYYAAKVAGGSVTPGEPTPKTPPLEGDRGPHPDLPNVPNSEALPTAEILPPAVAHEAQGAPMALLGEYIIRCIVSKDWRVREAGFIQAEHDLDHGVWADKGGDAASGSHAAIYAVRKCVTDKIANVFLPCMRLLQAAASSVFNEVLLSMCSSMPRGARELHTLLEPLMPSLADRLSDPNKRCQEASKNAIVAIAVNVGPSFATHHVMKISSRRALGSRGTSTAASSLLPNRALSARCEVLQLVLDTCGLMASEGSSSSEGNSHGGGFTAIPLLTMAFDLIKQCPASEVRAAAISLAAKVCSLVGPEAIRPFIKGIERQSQREVSGGDGLLETCHT